MISNEQRKSWRDAVAVGMTELGLSDWVERNATPSGCTCDPGDWSIRPIPEACKAFTPDKFGTCTHCEHDKECHK